MAAKSPKKKTAAKRKRKVKEKAQDVPLEQIESDMEHSALNDFAETTKADLKKLGDKIHEATDRGVHVVKDIAEHVQRFANDATELTKIKIDLHNLKSERTKLYTLMGEQLRNLYISKELTGLKKRFTSEFKKLDELETAIADKEKRSSNISISEDMKKL